MFDKDKVIDAAKSASDYMIAWQHSYHPFYNRLKTALKTSTQGIYVNSLAGIGFEMIEKTMYNEVKGVPLIVDEYYEIYDATGGADFTNVGAANNNTGTIFKASGVAPTSWGTGELRLISCNNYLENVYDEELIKVINLFIEKCKDRLKSKHILSNMPVIDKYVNDFESKVTKSGSFVGFLINPSSSQNIKMAINYLGLQLDTAQSLTIYLYETTQKTAVKSYSFNYNPTAGVPSLYWSYIGAENWILTTVMDVKASQANRGNQYLLGYFEDDLTGQALEMLFDKGYQNIPFRSYGKYSSILPVKIPSQYLNAENLPDNEDLGAFASDYMHGLYFKFNLTCDITNLIVDNIVSFEQALQYAIAIRLLDDAVRSGSDGKFNSVKDSMTKEWEKMANHYRGILYGGYDINGVKHRGILDGLTVDFSGLDSICLKEVDNQPTATPLIKSKN